MDLIEKVSFNSELSLLHPFHHYEFNNRLLYHSTLYTTHCFKLTPTPFTQDCHQCHQHQILHSITNSLRDSYYFQIIFLSTYYSLLFIILSIHLSFFTHSSQLIPNIFYTFNILCFNFLPVFSFLFTRPIYYREFYKPTRAIFAYAQQNKPNFKFAIFFIIFLTLSC